MLSPKHYLLIHRPSGAAPGIILSRMICDDRIPSERFLQRLQRDPLFFLACIDMEESQAGRIVQSHLPLLALNRNGSGIQSIQ